MVWKKENSRKQLDEFLDLHLAILCDNSRKTEEVLIIHFLILINLLEFFNLQCRWYYYSGMKKDECLLFKQWDSDTTQVGRMCFHTSFHDEKAPECASRQSIETR